MAPAPRNAKAMEEARKVSKTDPGKAEAIYNEFLSKDPGSSEAAQKDYEAALMGLGELYRDHRYVLGLSARSLR